MEAQKSRTRRRYSRELKDQIIAECEMPGASVAKVALSHGITANIVHGWRKLAGRVLPAVSRPGFIPVAVAPVAYASAQVTLKSGSRPWMLMSTTACMDIWALQT